MEARGVTQEDTDESREEFGWWVELFLYMEMSMEMRVGRKVEGGERIERRGKVRRRAVGQTHCSFPRTLHLCQRCR